MRQKLKDVPTIGTQGGVIGRPRAEAPVDAAERINALAAKGASKHGIACALRVSKDTFNRWLTDNPELEQAFLEGRESERVDLHDVLYQAAMKGNIVAAMFLLKSRHGYVEGDQGEQATRLNVTFNLPGAMTPEQFKQQVKVVNE